MAWNLNLVAAQETTRGQADLAVFCDVSNPASVELAATQTFEKYGNIYGLVNVAGIIIVQDTVEDRETQSDPRIQKLTRNFIDAAIGGVT